jgi:hypothetical protein
MEEIMDEQQMSEAEAELNALMEKDAEMGAAIKSAAQKIVTGGDLDIRAIERTHELTKHLAEMAEKYRAAGVREDRIAPVLSLAKQMSAVGGLDPLRDPGLLVKFERPGRAPKIAARLRAERDSRARAKLDKNTKYTYVDPSKLLRPLEHRLPAGRKHYADAFISVLMEFVSRKALSDWSVWLTYTMTSVYKLRKEEYDYEFLQRIVELMEGTFGMTRLSGMRAALDQLAGSFFMEVATPASVAELLAPAYTYMADVSIAFRSHAERDEAVEVLNEWEDRQLASLSHLKPGDGFWYTVDRLLRDRLSERRLDVDLWNWMLNEHFSPKYIDIAGALAEGAKAQAAAALRGPSWHELEAQKLDRQMIDYAKECMTPGGHVAMRLDQLRADRPTETAAEAAELLAEALLFMAAEVPGIYGGEDQAAVLGALNAWEDETFSDHPPSDAEFWGPVAERSREILKSKPIELGAWDILVFGHLDAKYGASSPWARGAALMAKRIDADLAEQISAEFSLKACHDRLHRLDQGEPHDSVYPPGNSELTPDAIALAEETARTLTNISDPGKCTKRVITLDVGSGGGDESGVQAFIADLKGHVTKFEDLGLSPGDSLVPGGAVETFINHVKNKEYTAEELEGPLGDHP